MQMRIISYIKLLFIRYCIVYHTNIAYCNLKYILFCKFKIVILQND